MIIYIVKLVAIEIYIAFFDDIFLRNKTYLAVVMRA
jgi:hypothetical protein